MGRAGVAPHVRWTENVTTCHHYMGCLHQGGKYGLQDINYYSGILKFPWQKFSDLS